MQRLESIRIRGRFDYPNLLSLSTEARQKLERINPETLAQASRIPGVSPSDINVLHISDEPDFISLYLPLALLTTTTLVEPERMCFLRTYMVQWYTLFRLRHPIILRNSLIIIVRHLMANKSDEVRKKYIYDV